MEAFNIVALMALAAWVGHLRLMQDDLDERQSLHEHPFLSEDSGLMSAYLMGQAEGNNVPKQRPSTKKRPLKGAKK